MSSIPRLVLTALAIVACSGIPSAAHAADGERCRLLMDGAPAVFAECLPMQVPVDPAQPDGPTLTLFVARIASQSATPEADPLVLISGGPGQGTVDFYLQMRGAFEQVRRDRDLLLIDQRGTGRSAEGFRCPTPDDAPALEEASPQFLADMADTCLQQLQHDPRLYTTSVAVQDLDRVRAALGYQHWNLYGVSYGTRVAQHYLRRYPAHTRALILDAVVPADVVLGPEIGPLAQQALDAIFDRCAADQVCADRFGDLPASFVSLREAVEDAPATVAAADPRSGQATTLELGIPQLQAVVRLMTYSTATAALLPLTITEAAAGNYLPMASQAAILLRGVEDAIGLAMHNSVICTEDIPFVDPDPVAGATDSFLGTTVVDGMRAICDVWPAGVLDEDFRAPLASEVPVLMLSGENDPITPPAYAEQAIAGGLRNVKHLIAEGQGHGLAAIGCTPALMRAFLRNPDPAQLDGACLARERATPFFLDFSGPSP